MHCRLRLIEPADSSRGTFQTCKAIKTLRQPPCRGVLSPDSLDHNLIERGRSGLETAEHKVTARRIPRGMDNG
jgi:hypothetical protein